MRKFVKAVLIVAIVLFGLALLAQFGLSRMVTHRLQRALPQLTGTAATVEAVRLSPFTGAGEIIGLRIPNPEGFAEPEALSLDRARVRVELLSLMGPALVVREISVDGARISYERRADGRDNLAWLRERMTDAAARPAPPAAGVSAPAGPAKPPAPAKPPRKLIVDSLVITNCRVRVAGVLSTNVMALPLPTVAMRDLGRAQGGLTPAEVGGEVLRAITTSAIQAALQPGSQAQGLIRNLVDNFRKHNKGAKAVPKPELPKPEPAVLP